MLLGGQRAAEILLVAVEQLADRAVDVHLVEQVQAAAQVEAQRHGPQADACGRTSGARDARASADT